MARNLPIKVFVRQIHEVLIIAFTVGLLCCTAAAAAAQDYVGTWQGSATQPGSNVGSFSISMKLTASAGSIDFASLGCGGSLSLAGQNGTQYLFRENLQYGTTKCVPGLVVRISLRSGSTMAWEEATSTGEVLAFGMLTRVGGGYTGTKSYHLTAKSWIDSSQINEWSFRGLKFLFESNTSPRSPQVTSANDFKIYQTFVVEVKFVDGSIVSARFLPQSLDHRVGATVVPVPGMRPLVTLIPIQGQVRVTDQKEEISPDKRSVTFRRTVEANPSLWILVPDAFDPVGSTNFRAISDTLEVTVTAEGADASGSGTAFPSHRFWIGDTVFRDRPQSRPSDYFGSR